MWHKTFDKHLFRLVDIHGRLIFNVCVAIPIYHAQPNLAHFFHRVSYNSSWKYKLGDTSLSTRLKRTHRHISQSILIKFGMEVLGQFLLNVPPILIKSGAQGFSTFIKQWKHFQQIWLTFVKNLYAFHYQLRLSRPILGNKDPQSQ